ncbi:MBG domain-containing protein [Lacticaseibacillus rhamnosus]|uniref:MBG domain-containing protein n=2 Tax=Lacticaseibacillus rhamnosus TaxID=47715 RepID=UPI0011CA033C|nr:leucine-rich repeat protein [Lacticaseibacillus rhamnosus]
MKHSSKRVQSIQQAEKTVHVRFRMYKAKKRWLIAGTALLLMPAFFQPGQEVHADSKSPQTTAVTSQSGATAETTAKTATGNTQPAGTTTQNTAAASSSAAVNAASSATQSSASSTASSAVASTGDSAASTSDATDSKSLATDSAAVKPQTVTQEDRSLASAAVQTTSATASSASSSASSQASSAAQSATTTQASTQAPANATAAESTQTIGDYTYSLDTANGTATVTGRANANVTDINIGASVTYNGQTFKVTAINNGAFATLNNLGNVNVADTVTTIGENAFAYSQFTGNITIENAIDVGSAAFASVKAVSVTLNGTANIGTKTFAYANLSGGITIADAKTIGAEAFTQVTASSLTINGPADISDLAFAYNNISGNVTITDAAKIGKTAFASLKAKALTINGQTDIGEGAFQYAEITGSVNIVGAKTIGDSAFQFAKVTDAINVPDSVALGENAFYQVYAASLSMNGAATTFGHTAFAYSRIGQVTINAATIDQQAFYHLYTDQLTFGDDVRVITDGAFQFIENTKELPQIDGKDNPENQITTLNLPANIKTITNAAFYGAKLTTIAVAPASQLTTLGYQAFAFSTATSMNMPDSLEQIGDQAFYGGKLVKVAFGPKLQSIGNLAFAEFGPLTNVDFTRAAALETIGDSAFAYNTINNAIVFPAKLVSIGNAAFVGNRIPALKLNNGLQTIGDTAFGYNQIQNELVVPDSVTDIGKYAFVYNSISNLTLGNGLKTIGQEAFEANVILNALTIPSSVTTIGAKAFNVNLMPKVIIAGTPVIGKEAFSTNRITVLQASTAQPATPDALNQSADAYTDSAHVSLSDFFDVAISGVTHQDIVVSNIKGSNGVKVTFDTASKSFKMPAQTQGFSFDWSLKGNDGVTYTGHYNIHLDDPVIRAHDISLFTGQVWKPELNFIDAVKQDGTSVPLSELTWTVTDENGKIVAEKDKDGIVTGDVDNTQPTTYTVTYTYGAESASAKIYYNQRLAASYALVGTQTATATGQPITVDTKLFSLSLGEGFDAGTLQLSDLNFFDANGNQVAADALTATGVYTVELSQAAWDRIAKLTNDSGQSAANFNFTGTSTAQLIIGLTATGKLGNGGFVYDGTTLASQAKDLAVTVVLSDGTQQTMNLTATDITLVEKDSANAGTYHYLLNSVGLARLQDLLGETVTIDQTEINQVSGTITITPADATVTGNNVSFVYDGQTRASDAKGIQATLKLGNTSRSVALTSSDIVVNNDGLNAGHYSYKLSDAGIAKLQQAAGSNYLVDTTDLAGTVTITPATATATGNDVSFIYDGQTKASGAKGIQATLKLEDTEQRVALSSADIVVNNDSVNAGQYSYKLSEIGIAKLQQAAGTNYQLSTTDLAGNITITPAVATADSNDVSFEYDGKTKASEAAGIQATIKLDTGKVVDLTATDIIVANDDVNAGQYSYQLSDAGKAKLQAATGNNYQLTADDLAKVAGTITITPATTTVDSNDVSFEYDGKTKASEAKGIQATIKLGEIEKTVDLASADIVVVNDGVDADQYNYQLSDTGQAKLQAATGNNYQLTADDLAKVAGTITITPATTTVDSNDVSFEYDGKTKASEAKGIQATIKLGETEKTVDLTSADIIVANDGVIVGKYTYSLSDSGKSKLQAATGSNYQLTTEALDKVSGSITITPAGAIATGKDARFEYDGKTKASEAKGIQAILTIDGTEKTVDLTAADIVVADDGVDAGKYSYRLSDAGKAKLQKEAGSDHQLTADDLAKVTGTITITPAIATADSNDVSFEYNGKTKASEAKGIQVTVKLGETEKTVELTSADIVAINDDVNAGQYIYELSDAGKAKLQAVTGNNYQLTADDLAKIAGTITITPAAASVDSNDVSFEYDGKTKASEAKGIQVTVKLGETEKTVDLNSADIVIENDGVDAGKYSYQLSDAGKSKLQTAVGNNYQLTAEELVKVTGTITITPAVTTADSNDVSFEYDGKTKASEVRGIQATVMLGKSGQVVALTSADVVVVNDGVDAGKYSYQLSDAGKAKLQAVTGNNYQLTADDLAKVTGTITITPATTTVDSNDVSFEYDGKTKASEAKGIQATVMLGKSGQVVALTSADVVVVNDGVDAGKYSYQLSDAGKAKLQAATGNNYQLTADDLAKVAGTITITPATTTADSNDVSFEYDGKTKASEAKGIQATIKLGEIEKTVDLSSADIIVANDGVVVGKYTYSLSNSGKSKLQAATGSNYQLTTEVLDKISGSITITPAGAIATGKDAHFEYDGKTKASEAKGIQAILTIDGTEKTVDLTAADIVVAEDGVDAGKYSYRLSDAGKAKLQREAGSDHQLTADDLAEVTGTITITPAIATADSNDVSFEYNGKTKASEARGVQAVVKLGESGKIVTLTLGDIVVTNDGVDAGQYNYELSDAGKTKLRAATGNNYQLTADDLAKVVGTITITPAIATADSNDVSFEYDGKTKASEAKGIQATVKLGESEKTVDLTSADIIVANDGVTVGKYTYSLSSSGKAKLQTATGNNYQLTADDLAKVVGTITITPAITTVDSNDVSFEYDGKTKASEAKGIQVTIKLGESGQVVALTSTDIVVVNDGVNVGQYIYKLSDAGKAKLQTATGNNYQLTADDLAKVTGTVTITPAIATANSNDVSFEYDGKTKASEAKGIQATVKLGESEKTVDLTSADIIVANDGATVGKYTYSLSDSGKAKLIAATGNNYQLTVDDLAKVAGAITITPATASVDSNDVSFEYDGKTKASEAKGIQATVTLGETKKTVELTSADIVVENDDVDAGKYSYQLSDAGKAKLIAATGNNYQLTADDLAKITGTITIIPAVATADSNNVSFEYNGKTKASEAKGIQATVKLGENGKTVALTAADIVVINDGVNAGQYDYKLSAAGMTKLRQATGTNYQFKKEDLTKLGGTVTITPATALADLNDVSFSYDGQTKASQAHDLTANIKLGTKVVSVHLNATDIVVTDDGVGVGQYQYSLDANGIAKLRQASGDNYQFDVKVLAGLTGTITIKPVTGAVTVNDTSFVYDGHTKASAAAGLQASLYLPQAEAKATIQLTREDILVTNDGTAAGTYRYRLSQTGIAKLQKAVGKNYELDQDELAGLTGTITITPLTVNATVNHGQFQYNGVTRASQAGGLAITVQLPEKSQKIALTNTDIAVENDSVNVGTYTYHLTASGLAKLAVAIGPNYQVTDQTFSGTITITPAPISATLSGLQKKTYDGQPGALNDDYYRLILGDGTEIQLQAGDLIFVDGQAPVNPGSYAVSLSTSGLQRIKALLPNNLLKNVNTQQAIFKIVALPSPDPGTGTTPDTPGHHLPDTGTDTGTTPGTPDHHLPNTGTGTQQSEISTHNGTKHRLPQTGDTQSQTLSLMGLLLATMSGLFGLAGRKRKAHR